MAESNARWDPEAGCGRFLERFGPLGLIALVPSLWLPIGLGLTPLQSLFVLMPVFIAAASFWRAEPIETRARWLGVFMLALLGRLILATLAVYFGAQNGLRLLGPDGSGYWRVS